MTLPTLLSAIRIAFYLRYSCDKQSPTSCEDQLRRCHELARRYGLSTDQVQVFSDDALSATGKDDAKRTEYQRLIAAWEAGQFDVLIVDEWSRLTREGVEHAKMVQRLEDNRRIRLITGNGLDTNLPNWQLVAALFGMVGQQSTRDTQYRVTRGMVGQLERGYMVASAVFGYNLQHEYDGTGRRVGTHWVVNEAQAAIVREIYARREQGQSMHQIARWLNENQVPTSRKARKNSGGYWRPSRVRGLLSNAIYRGEFQWHNSANYQAMAKKKGLDDEVTAYPRPHLRLVSNETWYRCNTGGISRSGYGGGKHALSGLLTCGCCGSTLVLSTQKRCRSLYCAQCTVAKASFDEGERQTVTVATVGVERLLKEALSYFLTTEFIEAFRASLRQKLEGNPQPELEALRKRLRQLETQQERYSRLLAGDTEDEVLEKRYLECRQQVREAKARLQRLEAGIVKLDAQAVEAQLRVDPRGTIEGFFDSELPPERLRAVLARLFPSIVFLGKRGRYNSFFSVEFAAGSAMSLVSETETVDTKTVTLHFRLRYTPDNWMEASQRWSVAMVTAEELAGTVDSPAYRPLSVSRQLMAMACAA
ncbi:recombinase family protein [Oryzomicrobium sp.]|uniref:recombinase family protein n=1 Tax=Oryzomicrobium sp. TaxID=1911578 RepID=UPI0026001E19|nr:recombinase family protein [Oryzomicrobium sp.]MCE1243790.1 recombinase family protein [Oryzomicrobium sp.]